MDFVQEGQETLGWHERLSLPLKIDYYLYLAVLCRRLVPGNQDKTKGG